VFVAVIIGPAQSHRLQASRIKGKKQAQALLLSESCPLIYYVPPANPTRLFTTCITRQKNKRKS